VKPTEKQRKEVARYIKKWREGLLLNEWSIDTWFMPEDKDGHAAEVLVEVNYLRASIRIYPCYWENTRRDREEFIVHELCHCITEEIYEACFDMSQGRMITPKYLEQMREQLTQRISNIAFY